MHHRNHNGHKHKKSHSITTIPPAYAEYPPELTRWVTAVDNYAKHKKRKLPRALRHHYD